ncbi:PP0621 family protein [Nitratifractor sp.]|uniref:PP0621 family protein n=1 Tax=Nitratifractor sp. TaxID=2268144 RepID=UPI0025FF5A80|nr:PP0621 family protein [Nitratifractor sp.]
MWLKLLIIGGILYALYRVAGGSVLPGKKENRSKEAEEAEEGETLVECSKCSTYVVKKEAIFYRGKYYCSRECLPK